MNTLGIVLAFPLIVLFGYAVAYLLLRRDTKALAGMTGFVLYLALLAIPLVAVLVESPDLPPELFAGRAVTPAWIAAGIAVGLTLWRVQRLTARREAVEPGIWVGPPGWAGFVLLMAPVTYIVVAEEIVWRGYLTPALSERLGPWLGVPLAALAFGLHHYHFGLRHVVFSFAFGLVLAALFLVEGRLFAAVTAHLVYNALAWAWMRKQAHPESSSPSD
jgi:membrane protease YdiL (CAAX protease family)